jgi:CBS domain-containing protein
MRDARVRRVPVVDEDGHPVGIVSMNDLARLASGTKRSVTDRELVRTLATVSQPRGNGLHANELHEDTLQRAAIATQV